MDEQYGACLAHSRCSGNVSRSTEFELLAYIYKLGDSTRNPKLPALFENP